MWGPSGVSTGMSTCLSSSPRLLQYDGVRQNHALWGKRKWPDNKNKNWKFNIKPTYVKEKESQPRPSIDPKITKTSLGSLSSCYWNDSVAQNLTNMGRTGNLSVILIMHLFHLNTLRTVWEDRLAGWGQRAMQAINSSWTAAGNYYHQ